MANDGDVVARGSTQRATVTRLVLDVGENGTFGNGVQGKDVADCESCVLSSINELEPYQQPFFPFSIFKYP